MKRPSQAAAPARHVPLALANPPTTATISVEELAKLTNDGLHSTYEKVRGGVYPSIRLRKGKYAVLTQPTLEILAGLRAPGGQVPDRPDGAPKKRRRRVARKSRKGEVPPPVPS
jgi:hypothetical protein